MIAPLKIWKNRKFCGGLQDIGKAYFLNVNYLIIGTENNYDHIGLANEMLNRWDVAILNYEKATIAYKEIAAEEQVRKVGCD